MSESRPQAVQPQKPRSPAPICFFTEKTDIQKAIGEGIISLHTGEKMIAATDDKPGKIEGKGPAS